MNLRIIFTIVLFCQFGTVEATRLFGVGNSGTLASRFGGLTPLEMKILRILLDRKRKYGHSYLICRNC